MCFGITSGCCFSKGQKGKARGQPQRTCAASLCFFHAYYSEKHHSWAATSQHWTQGAVELQVAALGDLQQKAQSGRCHHIPVRLPCHIHASFFLYLFYFFFSVIWGQRTAWGGQAEAGRVPLVPAAPLARRPRVEGTNTRGAGGHARPFKRALVGPPRRLG